MKKGSSSTTGNSARIAAASATRAQSFGPENANAGSRMSHLGDVLAAHQAGGADGEDQQDEQEGDALLEIGVEDAEELLEQADHQAADENADGVLETAEDRRREGLDPRH